MTDIQDITEEEASNNLSFLITMCERNRTVWRIKRPDGCTVLLSPLIQHGPPIDQEVISQVEEFKKEYMESTPDEAQVDKAV
tara:strand:- start:827 stop:1072 length:246 start_codon:yes stop_codon:yes gene_type:complete